MGEVQCLQLLYLGEDNGGGWIVVLYVSGTSVLYCV